MYIKLQFVPYRPHRFCTSKDQLVSALKGNRCLFEKS